MQRRDVLQGIAATAAATFVSGAGASEAEAKARGSAAGNATPFHRDWGAGKAVVLLAGWGMSSEMWGPLMLDLVGRGHRCVAPDRRGHGRSADPGRGYDYDTLADDVADLLERLDLRDVTLVGHSMAGGEVVRLLSRHGAKRVARIVLVAPTTPFLLSTAEHPVGVPEEVFAQARAAIARDFPAYLTTLEEPFFGTTASRELVQWGRSLSLQSSLLALVACHEAFSRTDFRAELKRIAVPALVIHGDADASTPLALTGKPTAEMIPGCRLSVFEGAPHGLVLTHVERLAAELAAFAAG